MADHGIPTNVGSGGASMAADFQDPWDYPYAKMAFGASGTVVRVSTAAGGALPTSLYSALGALIFGEPTDAKNTATDTTAVGVIALLKMVSAVLQFTAAVATATLSSLASGVVSAQLLASTAGRRGLILQNTDAYPVFVKFGISASASSFTVMLRSGEIWAMPMPIYTGRIDAVWLADGAGSLMATELT